MINVLYMSMIASKRIYIAHSNIYKDTFTINSSWAVYWATFNLAELLKDDLNVRISWMTSNLAVLCTTWLLI